jgi:hypothetical protein
LLIEWSQMTLYSTHLALVDNCLMFIFWHLNLAFLF